MTVKHYTFALSTTKKRKKSERPNGHSLFFGYPERMYAFVGFEPDIIALKALTVMLTS